MLHAGSEEVFVNGTWQVLLSLLPQMCGPVMAIDTPVKHFAIAKATSL